MHAAHQRKWEQRTEFARHIHNMHFINKIRAKKKCFAKIQQMRQNDDSKQGTKRVELMFSKECEEKTYRQRFGWQCNAMQWKRKCSIPLRTIRVVLWRCFIFILRYNRARRNRHKMCEIETNRQTMTTSSTSAREYVSTLCAKLVQIDRTYVSCNYFIRFSFEPF